MILVPLAEVCLSWQTQRERKLTYLPKDRGATRSFGIFVSEDLRSTYCAQAFAFPPLQPMGRVFWHCE